MVLTFFLHPHFTKRIFEVWSCESVYNENRLYADLDLLCDPSFSSQYYGVWVLAWIALLIGVVGIPLIALWALQRRRDFLSAPHTRHLFGFLFIGYRERYYWWEIWAIYRKALLYALVVVLQPQGTNLQLISVLLLLLVIMLVQFFCQPYENAYFDSLEQLGLGACALYIFMALYMHNVEFFSNEWVGSLGSTVTILVNLAFLLIWLAIALRYLYNKVNQCRKKTYTESVRQIAGYDGHIRPCGMKGIMSTRIDTNVIPSGAGSLEELQYHVEFYKENDSTQMERKNMVYKVGDVVECRLAANLADRPIDRLDASVRSRWFRGKINSINWEGNATVLGMPAEPRYYIDVEIPANKVDKMCHYYSRLFKCCTRELQSGGASHTDKIEQVVTACELVCACTCTFFWGTVFHMERLRWSDDC